jgi:hypothetical protein
LIITAVVTGTITWIVSNALNALKQKSLKYKGMKKKEYEEMISDIANSVAEKRFKTLEDSNKQMEQKIDSIEKDVAKLKEGTQASLRNDCTFRPFNSGHLYCCLLIPKICKGFADFCS